MEVNPPEEVWVKLAAALDEINEDNALAEKIQSVEIEPLPLAWENIKYTLQEPAVNPASIRKHIVIPFRRIAAAAVMIGLIAATYFLFFNRRNDGNIADKSPSPKTEVTILPDTPGKESSAEVSNTATETPPVTAHRTNQDIRQAGYKYPQQRRRKESEKPVLLTSNISETEGTEELKEKIFTEQIDDLSRIASDDRYLTMVSADGRMVKIPARFSNLAPYLQDNSTDEAYIDLLFEESTYWKEKFREWRQKLAQSPVTPSMENFFDIIGLMKSIQDN